MQVGSAYHWGASIRVVRRLFTVAGVPIGVVQHRLPADLVPALTEDAFGAISPEGAYRTLGLDIDH